MATPKVFISSTCYDLGQIRDSLSEFISSYYFDCLLSERGDVFYHPDLHTHESCLNEIENCQLFILIIGGRFGGTYKYDTTKSITNAEYEAAKYQKIPVFTFVKKDLFDDHKLYQKNRQNKDLVKQIIFPSIDNQDYAINIFEFINSVRLSDVNNGIFSFEYVKDIKQFLGKQWAGMLFNFLNERNKDKSQILVNKTLDNLTLINKKTEELIEGLVKKFDPTSGKQKIEDLDKIVEGSRFYTHILRMFKITQFSSSEEEISLIDPIQLSWYEYVAKFKDFRVSSPLAEEEPSKYKTILGLICESNFAENVCYWTVKSEDDVYPQDVVIAMGLFKNLQLLNKDERLKALSFITSTKNML
jgi:hypothetical protein